MLVREQLTCWQWWRQAATVNQAWRRRQMTSVETGLRLCVWLLSLNACVNAAGLRDTAGLPRWARWKRYESCSRGGVFYHTWVSAVYCWQDIHSPALPVSGPLRLSVVSQRCKGCRLYSLENALNCWRRVDGEWTDVPLFSEIPNEQKARRKEG